MRYDDIISTENLFQAWEEFRKGKRGRKDVQAFERSLEDNLFTLHESLKSRTYRHGGYEDFYVQDPKRRHIHKASVPDRTIHHLLYKYLYELFDKTFIYDSYSCRLEKGTHKAVDRLEKFARIVSKNYTRPCWALKCDIKKFFASVDHEILLAILKRKVNDKDILWISSQITASFHSEQSLWKGIPLGNVTSQIFANLYLNELDQFVKHRLGIRYYLRYADDFLLLSTKKEFLKNCTFLIERFLQNSLKLSLHSGKIILRKLDWGIDFLGYVVLPHYRLPRTETTRRIFKKLKERVGLPTFTQSLQSYLGYLSHANSFKLTREIKNLVWSWGL